MGFYQCPSQLWTSGNVGCHPPNSAQGYFMLPTPSGAGEGVGPILIMPQVSGVTRVTEGRRSQLLKAAFLRTERYQPHRPQAAGLLTPAASSVHHVAVCYCSASAKGDTGHSDPTPSADPAPQHPTHRLLKKTTGSSSPESTT